MKLKARIIDKTAMKIIVMQNKRHVAQRIQKVVQTPPYTHKIQEAEEVNYDWDYKRGFKENILELDLEE